MTRDRLSRMVFSRDGRSDPSRGFHAAAGDVGKPLTGLVDDAESGHAQSGIDAEYAHRRSSVERGANGIG